MRFQSKVAVVTGAGRGIGRAIALGFAREGAHLLLCERDEKSVKDTLKEIEKNGAESAVVIGDVADPETAKKAAAAALKKFGQADVLVNNAGINTRSSFLELSSEDWMRVLNVNLNGTFHFLKAFLPIMSGQKSGAVVNISSSAAKTPHANAAAAYGASKGGVNALTRQLASEMAKYGVRVNAACPGPVETDMSLQWTEEYRRQVMQKIPLGRLGKPEDVANLVLFLASDEAAFITGETININGGTYMD